MIIQNWFDNVYEDLEDYNQTKKRRVLIVFGDIIADNEANTKLSPIVTELFLEERKLNVSLIFISQSYFRVSKTIRLNTYHEIPNKREVQHQINLLTQHRIILLILS